MPAMSLLLGLGAAYVLGSVPTGYWLAKGAKGLDIRRHGSGNIGASNVGRVLGKAWGMAVLVFDILKGSLAVLLGQAVFYSAFSHVSVDLYKILCAVAAVCGHNWSIFLGFQGGKGVATSAGALLGVTPLPLILSVVAWGAVAKLSSYVCLASIGSALAYSLLICFFKTSTEIRIFGWMLAIMMIIKHRSNIQRLRLGTEPKIGQAKPQQADHAVQ